MKKNNTRFITLLGTPLRQSFAARMQNAAFRASGLDIRYFYTEVDNSGLEGVFGSLRNAEPVKTPAEELLDNEFMDRQDLEKCVNPASFLGFAVTKPNKLEVLKYLDKLDPLAEKVGAVNTVRIVRNTEDPEAFRLVGYNTDALGFKRVFQEMLEKGIFEETDDREKTDDPKIPVTGDPEGSAWEKPKKSAPESIFLFGAGGAGRAISFAIAESGASKIYINDIDEAKGLKLAEDLNRFYGCETGGAAEFAEKFIDCPMVINATGLGMGGNNDTPLKKEMISPGRVYYDACYNPAKTRFLRDAESLGCRVFNGLEMSLYQGTAQFEILTGEKAPETEMRRELDKILAEKNSR